VLDVDELVVDVEYPAVLKHECQEKAVHANNGQQMALGQMGKVKL
jgi:hypothetical protein